MRPTLPFLLAVGAGILAGCAREHPTVRGESALAAVRVQVAPVQRETTPIPVEIMGTVRPRERAVVAAKLSATIESLPITLGQTVKHGELLARLTAPELTARLAQANAQLAQAEREEKRNRELAATGADSADAARAAVDRLRLARATLSEAEAMLGYAEIHAPFDGRVAQKLAYTGDFVSPGQPLLVLEGTAAFQIEAAVPASLAAGLKLGANVTASIADVTAPISCTVDEIAAAADAATHTVLVKLSLSSNDGSLSGRSARIALPGPAAEMLFVPASAVTRLGQMERTFIVADGRAQLRLVKTGALRGDRIELLSGVSAGEHVVVTPPAPLRDGQPVTPAP